MGGEFRHGQISWSLEGANGGGHGGFGKGGRESRHGQIPWSLEGANGGGHVYVVVVRVVHTLDKGQSQ